MYTFIKLGGSVITQKGNYKTLRRDNIARILKQVAAYTPDENEKIWLFHGAGSYGHHTAKAILALPKKEQTLDKVEMIRGEVAELCDVVRESGERLGIQLRALHPHTIWDDEMKWQTLLADNGILMHGDALHTDDGLRIVSTEDILVRLCGMIDAPIRVLLLCDTDGVYDEHGKLMPVVSGNIEKQAHPHMDVTGGMEQKVRESMAMVSQGAEVMIANGSTDEIVSDWLRNQEILGTRVLIDSE